MKTFLALFLGLAALAGAASPEKKTPPTVEQPEEVAHTYIRAMADLRLNVVADSMHPGALERFKEILAKLGEALAAAPPERQPPPKMIAALFGEAGPAGIKDQPSRDVFVGFMSNLTTFLPQLREMTAGSEYQVIGHVEEGNLCHVVFRATLRRGKAEMTKMDVLSLKRDGDTWKVLLTDDLTDVIVSLGRSLLSPPAKPGAAPEPKTP